MSPDPFFVRTRLRMDKKLSRENSLIKAMHAAVILPNRTVSIFLCPQVSSSLLSEEKMKGQQKIFIFIHLSCEHVNKAILIGESPRGGVVSLAQGRTLE